MAVLIQSYLAGMTSAQYDATNKTVAPQLDGFEGFLGLHAAAVVDGGMQITELWSNEAAYKNWISTVIAKHVPAEAVTAMQTTFQPLHNVVSTKALALA